MKVFELLVVRPNTAVTRRELFDHVWKDQQVSDDALTRSISDIRDALHELTGNRKLIETLPKRGYRWKVDVSASDAPTLWAQKRWLRLFALYFLLFALVAGVTAVVFGNVFAPEHGLRIAVLTPEWSVAADAALADVHEAAARAILGAEDVDLLSRAATRSVADQPYPRLFFEYRVQWAMESRITRSDKGYSVVLSLIDARTGLVADMRSVTVTSPQEISTIVAGFVRDALIPPGETG